ncbi:TRAP transporter fused permease subunit [Roseovarius nubinhibens]|uniref:TRAP transporter permease n=1 Tax=Roseovarius nubinhibens TaxID=314263 RepID=UPI001C0951C5|nr:TRAP transporter fused permease subunit [Roseovarius nubinhibens]MBU2999042.1 TRAP transporter fused permease subunit [Roseovarius nubinhibens]
MTSLRQTAGVVTRDRMISGLALLMLGFHLLAASPLWLAPNLVLRAGHMLFAALIVILLFPLARNALGRVADIALAALSVVSIGYAMVFAPDIVVRPPWTLTASPFEIFVALGTVFVALEITRRSLGIMIPALCLIFIAYAFVGPYLRFVDVLRPLAHGGVDLSEFVDQMYFSFEGIFGTALGVSAEYIFLFVMFGAVLQVAGGGDFFIAMTRAVTGTSRGGPAKIAVVASGLMGMMSGSSVANVATTGSLTIPMMKNLGYPARFAGAIEAIASTGGQITPPIMGAAAFLMAAILGIEYVEVVLAASLPALLFFGSLLISVHLMALRHNLAPLPRAEAGSTRRILAGGWTFLLPVAVLVVLMLQGFTPSYAAFFGLLAALVTPFLRRSTFISADQLSAGVRSGVEGAVVVAAACASAGIIVGIVQISGLGFRFSALVTDFSGGSLNVALVLAMLAAFIFGMGMPTTAAYIIQATLVAPALIKLGADPLAAHMFVFYFAVLGQITPPLAVAAYAAAPIAGESASRVGWAAFAIGLPIYIIPFLFVLDLSLLYPQWTPDLAYTFLRSGVALFCMSSVIVGWFGRSRLAIPLRAGMFAVTVLMIHPNIWSTVAGLGLLAGIYALQIALGRGHKEETRA